MRVRQVVIWGVFLLVVAASLFQIVERENILARGQVIFLELQPVDPRSLIQGDYMNLRYAIHDDLSGLDHPRRGMIVASLGSDRIARFDRVHDPQHPLAEGEILLRYYSQGARPQIGPTAFFFQEGDARYYADARFAELRVSDDGKSILMGLRGGVLEKLGPPENGN